MVTSSLTLSLPYIGLLVYWEADLTGRFTYPRLLLTPRDQTSWRRSFSSCMINGTWIERLQNIWNNRKGFQGIRETACESYLCAFVILGSTWPLQPCEDIATKASEDDECALHWFCAEVVWSLTDCVSPSCKVYKWFCIWSYSTLCGGCLRVVLFVIRTDSMEHSWD